MSHQDLVIRPYVSGDRAAIVGWLATSEPWLTLGYSVEEWHGRLGALAVDVTREIEVVEHDGVVVGITIVRRGFLLGDYLELLAIAPTVRQKGFGRALLSCAERRVFARARNFFLCVSDFNVTGREFYRRMGYRDVGVIEDLIVAGRSEILMRKTTGPLRDEAGAGRGQNPA